MAWSTQVTRGASMGGLCLPCLLGQTSNEASQTDRNGFPLLQIAMPATQDGLKSTLVISLGYSPGFANLEKLMQDSGQCITMPEEHLNIHSASGI